MLLPLHGVRPPNHHIPAHTCVCMLCVCSSFYLAAQSVPNATHQDLTSLPIFISAYVSAIASIHNLVCAQELVFPQFSAAAVSETPAVLHTSAGSSAYRKYFRPSTSSLLPQARDEKIRTDTAYAVTTRHRHTLLCWQRGRLQRPSSSSTVGCTWPTYGSPSG